MIKRFWILSVFCSVISGSTFAGWSSESINYIYRVSTEDFSEILSNYSNTPIYTFTFNNQEKLAGNQAYSINSNLTAKNVTENYVFGTFGNVSAHGNSIIKYDCSNPFNPNFNINFKNIFLPDESLLIQLK